MGRQQRLNKEDFLLFNIDGVTHWGDERMWLILVLILENHSKDGVRIFGYFLGILFQSFKRNPVGS